VTVRTKIIIAAIAAAGLLWWSSNANAAPPVDPNSRATLWNYVTKDGACYLVTFYANGTHTSEKVSDEPCDGTIDPGA